MCAVESFPGNRAVVRHLGDLLGSRKAIAFVGAGASAELYPLWNDLIRQLVRVAARRRASKEDREFWLSIASRHPQYVASAIEQRVGQRPFRDELARTFRSGSGPGATRFTRVHDRLARLPFYGYVTTNYDPGLLNARVALRGDASAASFVTWRQGAELDQWFNDDAYEAEVRPVLFAHGIYQDRATIVLGLRDYRQAYRSEPFGDVMRQLWSEERLVFVGYGFSDWRLNLIAEEVAGDAEDSPRHIALIGLPEGQRYYPGMRDLFRELYNAEVCFYRVHAAEDGRQDHSALYTLLDSLLDSLGDTQGSPLAGVDQPSPRVRLRACVETAGQREFVNHLRELLVEWDPGPRESTPEITSVRSEGIHAALYALLCSRGERRGLDGTFAPPYPPSARTDIVAVDSFWLRELIDHGCLVDLAATARECYGDQADARDPFDWDAFIDIVKEPLSQAQPDPGKRGELRAVPYYLNFGIYLANVRALEEWLVAVREGQTAPSHDLTEKVEALVRCRHEDPGSRRVPDVRLTWNEMVDIAVPVAEWLSGGQTRRWGDQGAAGHAGPSEGCLPFFFYPGARESLSCFFLEVLWDVLFVPCGDGRDAKLRVRTANEDVPPDTVSAVCAFLYELARAGMRRETIDLYSGPGEAEGTDEGTVAGRLHHSAVFYRHWYVSHRDLCQGAGRAGQALRPFDSSRPDLVPILPPTLTYPAGDGEAICRGKSMLGAWYWAVVEGSADPGVGLQWLQQLTKSDLGRLLSQLGAGIPARRDCLSDAESELLSAYFAPGQGEEHAPGQAREERECTQPRNGRKQTSGVSACRSAILHYYEWRERLYECCRDLLGVLGAVGPADLVQVGSVEQVMPFLRQEVEPVLRDFIKAVRGADATIAGP